MNANYSRLHTRPSLLALAVHAALIAVAVTSAAQAADDKKEGAADPAVAALTEVSSTVTVGAGYVSEDSFKFGEYNGLQDKGLYGIGNFDLRGGGRFDSDDVTRWRVVGNNLGLETRSLSAEYGHQGVFKFNVGYDELRHNISDSYQTPYMGAGSDTLTLPSNWLIPRVPLVSATAANARGLSQDVANSSALVAGVLTAPSAAQLATSATIIGADVPAFHNVDLHTKRTDYEAGLNYLLGHNWEFAISAKHEKKDGLKPMGTVTRTTGGDISTIIPDPIDQATDQFNASALYRGKKEFIQLTYYGSLFVNNIKSVGWSNWADPTASMRMSSAPGNQFHQFGLTAGYDFSRTSKLVANASYGHNTQDEAFFQDASMPLVPVASLNGLVITKALNVKFTARPTKALSTTVGYKYDDRDNRTSSNTYAYYDANEAAGAANANTAFTAALGLPAAALKSNANINANRPYGKKLNQLNLDADYFLARGNLLKAGYEWQQIDRSCNGTWIECVDAAKTQENTLRAEWRMSTWESVTTKIGYAYSKRTVSPYNENAFLAIVPMANVSPTGATGGASAYSFMLANGWTGYGPVAGYAATTGNMNLFFPLNNALANATYANQNRISELIGMRRYNMADRNRDKFRSSIEWQASEQLALQGGLDFNKDDYANSIYGLQSAKSWIASLDGTYAVAEGLTINVFYTYEDQHSVSAGNTYTANSNTANVNGFTALSGNSGCNTYTTVQQRNNNNKVDPCLNWSNDMLDKVHTLGATIRKDNLMAGKLSIINDWLFSSGRTDYDVMGGNYANNPLAVAGAPAGTVAAYYIPATALPTVSTDTFEVRIAGKYLINRASAVWAGYGYHHLKSANYAYEGMQFGGLTGVLPTNESAPTYSVHTVGLAYVHTF